MNSLVLRPDLQVIADLVPEKVKLLDIGCGEGELLAWLARHKQVDGRGIEISPHNVSVAMARGVPVIQADVNTDLADYPPNLYDMVILSQALQAMQDPKSVLEQLLRIADKAIVSVPNFGFWKNRLYLAIKGKMPVTKTLTYQWYDTPNIHFCTLTDFVELCEKMDIAIERRLFVNDRGVPSGFQGKDYVANLLGEQGVFVLSRKSSR